MLREQQKERIINFLKITDPCPWKVLILDQRTQEILSPLIRINELRDLNITTHFLLTNKRQPIKDIPAIYFIDSTEENIQLVINDVCKDVYSSYHLNFLNSIKREYLELIANKLAEKGKAFYVKSVFDQFLDFLALQENVFSLDFKSKEEDKIVNSLFGVFLTMKEPPYIITDSKTEEIGERLYKKIKNTTLIKDTREKPLLILLDRSFDLKTPVEHVWTYGALIDDLLEFKSNKVYLKQSNKIIDLDPLDDFWLKNKEEYFPVVAERVEKELVDYKKEMAMRCVDEKSNQKEIEETLEKAPELAKRKTSLHSHMTICLALVEIIKKRNIDDFYRIEKSTFKKNELLEIAGKGEEEDIIRLGASMLKEDNYNVVEAMFKTRKIDLNILKEFKNQNQPEIKEGTLYKQVVSNLLGSVKKLLPVNTNCPLSLYVERIFNSIKNQNFLDFNIKIPFGNHCYEKEINKIIVFFVGGGNFTEIKALNEYGRKIGLDVIYGATEIINAKEMIQKLKGEII